MRTIREGDRGATVEILQLGLHRAGLLQSAADGVFGAQTTAAVYALQNAQALQKDGIAGAQSWAALYAWLAGYIVHTVLPGETISGITGQHGSDLKALLTANPHVPSKEILVGTELKVPLNFPVVPTNIRWSFDLLTLVIEGLRARYPFIEVEIPGKSTMGRPIYLLRIGTGKTKVGYNAAHHANEWITTPIVMKFFERFANGVAQEGSIGGVEWQRIYNDYTLELVPMVNPDGVDLVTGALAEATPQYQGAVHIASHFPQIPFPEGWKANIVGIDPNLSYPASWESAKKIKHTQGYDRPAPRDYVGMAPLEAQESAVMHELTLARKYQLTLSYHSQGKLIYWKYKDFEPKGSHALAQRMQGVSGYLPSITPVASANAGYKDWFIQHFDRPGYTIEVGSGVNPLPLSQFDAIYQDNVGILLLGMIGLDDV
ncbi:MAG: peptidoglycan-binding protein [Oscillospiraceae bacterium]|jgi:g-D-glutamyl-meso-diaminopimelate peptidase|nr:peptidoglycan-binding protein [Oscillospiraceae bacterium]